MHERKSRQCQLLNSSNCSHQPSESTSEGVHPTLLSPHTHSLKDTQHLPPCSRVPQKAQGTDHLALPPEEQTLFTDRHSGICSPHRVKENVTVGEIKWAKRPRNSIPSLSVLLQVTKGDVTDDLMVRSRRLAKPLPDVLHQEKDAFERSHLAWDCQGGCLRLREGSGCQGGLKRRKELKIKPISQRHCFSKW